MIYRPSSGAKIKINAANPEKGLAARVFGIPDWSRTNGLSLRRRPLYPTELPGHIQKLFNFPPLQETNELPLRRGLLYPFNYGGIIFNFIAVSCYCELASNKVLTEEIFDFKMRSIVLHSNPAGSYIRLTMEA